MEQKKLDRISALYRKSQKEGLSEEERAEQAALRQEYRDSVRRSLAVNLDQIEILEPDGTKTKPTPRKPS